MRNLAKSETLILVQINAYPKIYELETKLLKLFHMGSRNS